MFACMKTARKGIALLSALFFAFVLAACQPVALGGGASGGPSIDPSAPVAVALLVPRGSGNTSDDLLAKSLENAARLAIADVAISR